MLVEEGTWAARDDSGRANEEFLARAVRAGLGVAQRAQQLTVRGQPESTLPE
jgi:hypothetical protein